VSRELIVVDIETNGLGPHCAPMEVAAINVASGEELYFVPDIHDSVLTAADPEALRVNRYFERGVFRKRLDREATNEAWRRLLAMLEGNTFGGSNPTFDTRVIEQDRHIEGQWHHRLADLSAFAAGVLGLAPTELPGLHKVCELLGVVNEEEHGALGDARATAECFRRLAQMTRTDTWTFSGAS